MFRSVLLVIFLVSSVLSVDYEVKGYVKDSSLRADLQEIEQLLAQDVSEDVFYLTEVNSGEMGNSLVTFLGYIRSSLEQRALLKKYSKNENFAIVFSRMMETIPAKPVALTATDTCQNGGSLLVNGSCACPIFVTGDHCESVHCQRKGIVEGVNKDRCYCPPGWYAEHCEIRGCRPPLNDNLNVDKRSFMLVLPVTESMTDVRTVLQNSLSSVLTNLTNKENPGGDSWLETYILYMFVQVDDTNVVPYTAVAAKIDDFMTALQNTTVQYIKQPSTYPMMRSLVNIQQFTRQMNPNSIIFAFTDSPDSDAGPVSYTIGDGTFEQQAAQTTMLWRSRIYVFFINRPSMHVNTSLDSYDTYRRLVTFVHGDLFVINESEVETAVESIIPTLYRPEYLDVRSFASCSELVLDIVRDYDDQQVTVFVTIDRNPSTPQNVTITATDAIFKQSLLPMVSGGPLWAVFIVPVGWNSVNIVVSPSATCSAKAFIPSKSTLLWAYSDDDYIDVGNCMSVAEMDMMITLQPINFDPLSDIFVEFTNEKKNTPFTWQMHAVVRAETDCTFVYKIPDLPHCAAGVFTQKYTLTTAMNRTIRRIHPGWCSHNGHNNGTQPIVQQYPTEGPGDGTTCYRINPADMGGKLHDFRQVIFAVEIAQEMGDGILQLQTKMENIISKMTADGCKRQFSLVVFDSTSWKTLVSDYDATAFISKFRTWLGSYQANSLPLSNGAFSMDAIYHAIELQLLSPSIVHVFTMSAPKSSNFYRVLPTDVQVNFFFISETGEIPSYNDYRIMQKQTGGRLLSVGSKDITEDIFGSSIYSNNLILDFGYQDCSKGLVERFPVEASAKTLELTLLGSSLNIVKVTITDGKNGTVSTDKQYRVVNAKSTVVLKYNLINGTYSPGMWGISFASTGSCFIEVRCVSDVNVAVGFTSDVHSDFPAHHPFNRRGQSDQTYAIVRSTTGLPNQIVVRPTDFNLPWQDSSANGATLNNLTKYDENSCVYQFRSQQFSMPLTNSVQVIVSGTDANGTFFQRIFNYYTPEDNGQECNGGQVNKFGECACMGNFTGEYCWDRICAYGSTLSRGICMCYQYYYGARCEEVLYDLNMATEPPSPPATPGLPTAPVTTVATSTVTGSSIAPTYQSISTTISSGSKPSVLPLPILLVVLAQRVM